MKKYLILNVGDGLLLFFEASLWVNKRFMAMLCFKYYKNVL